MLPNRAILIRLWGYLKPYWHLQVATFVLMMALAGLAVAIPGAVQYMIDDLIPGLVAQADNGIDWTPALMFGLVLIGIYFFRVFFSLIQDYLATRIGASILVDMRSELFEHLESVSPRFFQERHIGEINSRITADVGRIQNLLAVTLLMFVQNCILLVGILIYLLNVNWKMTLVALAPVPLTILLSHLFGIKMHTISRRLQETIARLNARLLESLSALRTIKAFGQEENEKAKVDGVLTKLRGLHIKSSVVNSLAMNLIHFVNMLGPVVVLAWGTYEIAVGDMKLGALMAFYMLLAFLYGPIQDLASVNVGVQAAMASVNRVFEYLDMPPGVTQAPHAIVLEQVQGALKFEDVSFSYDNTGFALENLSLTINPKETVAIVGPSGSGKTTIVNLIMRFFDPTSGRVTLDDVDLRQIDVKALRRYISLVDQEPTLFKMSVFENIRYADASASKEDVQRAAKIAFIHDFITGLKDGYETEIGERGTTVSGGEKQRLCLARAVLKQPPIIILDEATSALDSNSEELIQQALKKLLVDKTAIIVAHRLATVRHADRIVLMDEGKIIDEGTHDGLMNSSPLYRELASKQLML